MTRQQYAHLFSRVMRCIHLFRPFVCYIDRVKGRVSRRDMSSTWFFIVKIMRPLKPPRFRTKVSRTKGTDQKMTFHGYYFAYIIYEQIQNLINSLAKSKLNFFERTMIFLTCMLVTKNVVFRINSDLIFAISIKKYIRIRKNCEYNKIIVDQCNFSIKQRVRNLLLLLHRVDYHINM